MKHIIISIISILFFSKSNAQAIVKGSGVVYTNGAPTHSVSVSTDAEVAIDSTTFDWYEYDREASAWVRSGYRIQHLNTSAAPTYTPNNAQSHVVLNNIDSMYWYYSGTWRHINKSGNMTNLSVTGTSSPVTINSSTGTDITITAGGINTISATTGNITITATEADGSATNELQTITNSSNSTSHMITLSNSGGSIDIVEGVGVGLSTTGTSGAGILTITNTGDTNSGDDITTTTTANGDLSGTYPNPIVDGLQGNPVSNTTPTSGQLLTWNGSSWVPQNPSPGADNWGSQVVVHDASLLGDGTSATPLKVDTSLIATGWDVSHVNTIYTGSGTVQDGTIASMSDSQSKLSFGVSSESEYAFEHSIVFGNKNANGVAIIELNQGPDNTSGNGIILIKTSESTTNGLGSSVLNMSGDALTFGGETASFEANNTFLNAYNALSIYADNSINVENTSGFGIQYTNDYSASLITSPQSIPDVNTVKQLYIAGSGISVSNSGNFRQIINTAPDQTVSITNGGGVSVAGTYPNFTLTNTGDTNPNDDFSSFSVSADTGPNQTINSNETLNISGNGTTITTNAFIGDNIQIDWSAGVDDLTDVVITSPTTNQVLTFNGTNWINQAGGSGADGNGIYTGSGSLPNGGSTVTIPTQESDLNFAVHAAAGLISNAITVSTDYSSDDAHNYIFRYKSPVDSFKIDGYDGGITLKEYSGDMFINSDQSVNVSSSNKTTIQGVNGVDVPSNLLVGTSGTATNTLHVLGTARITGSAGTPTTLTGRDATGVVGNVIVGSGLSITAGTLSATGGSANYQTLKDEGTALTQQPNANFLQSSSININLSNDAANSETEITAVVRQNGITDFELATGSVTTLEIADQSVQGEDIFQMGATTGQVLAWNGTTWSPQTAGGSGATDLAIAGSTGTVTVTSSTGTDITVTPGVGMAISATTSNITISENVTSITPAQLTSDVNNWNPSGLAGSRIIRISGDNGIRAITGIIPPATNPDGTNYTIRNVGTQPLYFPSEHANSTASNRFSIFGGELILCPKTETRIIYDAILSRWIFDKPAEFPRVGKSELYYTPIGSATAADHGVTAFAQTGTSAGSSFSSATATLSASYLQTTGTTATGTSAVYYTKTGASLSEGFAHIMCKSIVSLPILSTPTERFRAQLRILNTGSTLTEQANSSLGIRYRDDINGGKWECFTRNSAGTETTLDSGVSVSANTMYELSFYVNKQNTEVRYYIDGVYVGAITTNMPPSQGVSPQSMIIKSVGTTARTLQTHHLEMNGIMSN